MTTDKNEVQVEKLTDEKVLDKLKAVYNEIFDLELDIADIAAEAKKAGLDSAMLKTLAKAVVYAKVSDLEAKCKKTLAKIEELV